MTLPPLADDAVDEFLVDLRPQHLAGAGLWPIESLRPYLPRDVDVRRTTWRQKLWGTFRCQTYWLLATRGAWRVLWALATTGRFEPAKTDRVTR